MIGWIAFFTAFSAPAICAPPATTAATLRELYESGVAWQEFLDAASARRALWVKNSDAAAVPDDLLQRARAVDGEWRILAVAIDACSDSVNTIPYIARLVDLVPSLDLRIVDSTVGREVMETHRTPDDRAATPTVILLDAEWSEAGCFVERPLPLQQWYAERRGTMPVPELTELKMDWYADDAGRSTLAEIVTMLESAAAGSPVCAAPPPDAGTRTASAR